MESGPEHMEFGLKHTEFGLKHMEFGPKHMEFGIISCPSLPFHGTPNPLTGTPDYSGCPRNEMEWGNWDPRMG